MTELRSERASLAAALTLVNAARRAFEVVTEPDAGNDVRQVTRTGLLALHDLETELRALTDQVQRGVHTNPPLVVFGNPPIRVSRRDRGGGDFRWVGRMSRNVHEIRYQHAEDGAPYKHTFEPNDVEMYAVERGISRVPNILLTSASGKPLWEDF